MNVGELKKILEGGTIPFEDDLRVTIRFAGGIGSSTVGVKSVSPGFDWTKGQLVLSPDMELCINDWYRNLKKGAGHDAAHIGMVLKAVEDVIDGHDEVAGCEDFDNLIDALRTAVNRLSRFQKQGF